MRELRATSRAAEVISWKGAYATFSRDVAATEPGGASGGCRHGEDGVVHGVSDQHVRQVTACVLQHALHVAFSFVVEEGVRHAVQVFDVLTAKRFHQIGGFVVLFAKIPRVRLDFDADAFTFDDRQNFFHRAIEHLFTNFGFVRGSRQLGVDHLHAGFHRNFNHPLPVAYGGLTPRFVRAGPAIHHDVRGDF